MANARITRRHFIAGTLAAASTLRLQRAGRAMGLPRAADVCRLGAEQEVGPFYIADELLRADKGRRDLQWPGRDCRLVERAIRKSRGQLQSTGEAILITSSARTCFMPKPVPLPPPGFDDLSVEEALDYLQSSGAESPQVLTGSSFGRQEESCGRLLRACGRVARPAPSTLPRNPCRGEASPRRTRTTNDLFGDRRHPCPDPKQ